MEPYIPKDLLADDKECVVQIDNSLKFVYSFSILIFSGVYVYLNPESIYILSISSLFFILCIYFYRLELKMTKSSIVARKTFGTFTSDFNAITKLIYGHEKRGLYIKIIFTNNSFGRVYIKSLICNKESTKLKEDLLFTIEKYSGKKFEKDWQGLFRIGN